MLSTLLFELIDVISLRKQRSGTVDAQMGHMLVKGIQPMVFVV